MKNRFLLVFAIAITFVLSGCALSPEYKQLQSVQSDVNQVEYVSDMENYGVENHLATPEQFYENGGDCEDYSLAKYYKLRKMGYEAEDLWIVLGYSGGEGHAILTVAANDTVYALDNAERRVSIASLRSLKPVMKYNENQVLMFEEKNFDSDYKKANLSKTNQKHINRLFDDLKQDIVSTANE